MSTRQRYEISICFQDKGGQKRYLNQVGSLWFDGQRGTIDLPPGVALVGGQPNVYINVDLPRDQRQGSAQQQRGGARKPADYDSQRQAYDRQGSAQQQRGGARKPADYDSQRQAYDNDAGSDDDGSDIPF